MNEHNNASPIGVEAVGTITEDGIDWLIEGGESAIPEGMTLLIAHKPITNDEGRGEVYIRPQKLPEPAVPEGFVIAPDYRGFAILGIGEYCIDHSVKGSPAEVVICPATALEKMGREVGDERENEEGDTIHPDDIAVRLLFENVAGLNALESQLRYVREVHFPDATPSLPAIEQANLVPLADDHKGFRVDYTGLLSQASRALSRAAPGQAEMLRQMQEHFKELGQRFYSGELGVVDEFLQLYCVEKDMRAAIRAKVQHG